MKRISFYFLAVFSILTAFSCGIVYPCYGYSPYSLRVNDYSSVKEFQRHFYGYGSTIQESIGDTVMVFGCLSFKLRGYGIPDEPVDSRFLLSTFFDTTGTSNAIFIENDANIDIPLAFYDKTLYVTGSLVYYTEMGCSKGVGLQLISIDTIPQYIKP